MDPQQRSDWLPLLRSDKIDETSGLLRQYLQRMNAGGTSSLELHNSLYPDSFLAICSKLFGENDDPTSSPSSARLRPFNNISCWLDWSDLCRFRRYEELGSNPATLATEFTQLESRRACVAINIAALLLPIPGDPNVSPSNESLFRDDPPRPILFRRALLPSQTQRLLASTNYRSPTHILLHGGMLADPLLPILMERYAARYNHPLLKSNHNGRGNDRRRTMLLGNGQIDTTVNSTTAPFILPDTHQRLGLLLSPRDALICYFCNYLVSRTRKWTSIPIDNDPRGRNKNLKNAIPKRLDLTEAHRQVPLSYQSIDYLTNARVYNDLLYDYVGNTFLPSHIKFIEAHPDAPLFLHAIISYWLMQNPPFLVPLPDQQPESASALPATELSQRIVAEATGLLVQQQQQNSNVNGKSESNILILKESHFGPSGPPETTDSTRSGGSSLLDGGITDGTTDHNVGPTGQLSMASDRITSTSGNTDSSGKSTNSDTGSSSSSSSTLFPPSYLDNMEVPPANVYQPPTLSLLEAVTIFIVMLMCDDNFHDVINATDGALPRSGGKRILDTALEYFDRDAFAKMNTFKEIEWNLNRCPSIARSGIQRVAPQELRQDLSGMIQYPEVFSRIHAPLFHFYRNHLKQSLQHGSPQLFVSTVDTLLVFLMPWRARAKYKGRLPDYDKLRRERCFSYNQHAASILQQKVNEARGRMNNTGTNPNTGFCRRQRLQKVQIVDRAVPVNNSGVISEYDIDKLLINVRSQGAYDSLSTQIYDFDGPLMKQLDNFTENNVKHFRSEASNFTKWVPWIRLHYLYYSHLLYITLDFLRFCTFSHESDGILLLECLERILDLFEPNLIDELYRCDTEWVNLFSERPIDPLIRQSIAQTKELELQTQMNKKRGGGGTMNNVGIDTNEKELLSLRLQLLCHRNLLKLPLDISPARLHHSVHDLRTLGKDIQTNLLRTIESRSVPKPLGIAVPESCQIMTYNPVTGNPVVISENLSYWENMEQIIAAFFTVFFGCCTGRLRSLSNVIAVVIVIGLERPYVFFNDIYTVLRDIVYTLLGTPIPAPSSFTITPGTNAERMHVVVDRLEQFINPGKSKNTYIRPTFFKYRAYQHKPLYDIMREKLTAFYNWFFLIDVLSPPVRNLLEPRIPAQFLNNSKITMDDRKEIFSGKGRIDTYQSELISTTGNIPYQDSSSTWESSLLLRLTNLISRYLHPYLSPLYHGLTNRLIDMKILADKFPNGYHLSIDFLRTFADLRNLFVLTILFLSVYYLGFFNSLIFWSIFFTIIRCFMTR